LESCHHYTAISAKTISKHAGMLAVFVNISHG
jgi:hypothetical protein